MVKNLVLWFTIYLVLWIWSMNPARTKTLALWSEKFEALNGNIMDFYSNSDILGVHISPC